MGEMKPREIVRRCIEFRDPPRIGLRLLAEGWPDDILVLPSFRLQHPVYRDPGYWDFGRDPELLAKVPRFQGQVRQDVFGNVWGRLEERTKGECILGAIEEGWEALEGYVLPTFTGEGADAVAAAIARKPDLYRMGMLPGMPFSIMRLIRGMEGFLTDLMLEEENVVALRDRIVPLLLGIVDAYAALGADGVYAGEDWGTQTALLVAPDRWRRVFKPAFAAVADRAHSHGMHFLVHSCGYVDEIIEDWIEAGVDVFQFDQPTLVGVGTLSRKYAGRVAFWCPVDIQYVMPTGDRARIEDEARRMIHAFGGKGGGFIGADYTDWASLHVKPEWADWGRRVLVDEGRYPLSAPPAPRAEP
jgi:uroporphyrinogen decarboxylase